jgi:hypothetical protein
MAALRDALNILPGDVHSAVFDDRIEFDLGRLAEPALAAAWADGEWLDLLEAIDAALADIPEG